MKLIFRFLLPCLLAITFFVPVKHFQNILLKVQTHFMCFALSPLIYYITTLGIRINGVYLLLDPARYTVQFFAERRFQDGSRFWVPVSAYWLWRTDVTSAISLSRFVGWMLLMNGKLVTSIVLLCVCVCMCVRARNNRMPDASSSCQAFVQRSGYGQSFWLLIVNVGFSSTDGRCCGPYRNMVLQSCQFSPVLSFPRCLSCCQRSKLVQLVHLLNCI